MTGENIGRDLEQLLKENSTFETLLFSGVEYLHNSNLRFHWTGIYELFPDDVLRLGPFIGAPTDHVFIAAGQGVCGAAVAEKRNINVPDVSKVSNYLACSAATKSELVVLIRKDDEIFAQIDIDSHELNAFDPITVARVEQVADWLAKIYLQHPNSRHSPVRPVESSEAEFISGLGSVALWS